MSTNSLSMLRYYMGDFRSLLPGGAAGIIQLMYPPLGAAVALQSDFFADPFGRVYRSIPQIWATVLSPDGEERARKVRDIHRNIKGADSAGRKFHALDPETYWWAHATFTWEIFKAIELFYPGGLKNVDQEELYAETVAWYGRYGVNMNPVPKDYTAFQAKFDIICRNTLELTPAAARTLEMGLEGRWRLPLTRNNFKSPLFRHPGRIVLLGTIPEIVRERFDIPWTLLDEVQFRAICTTIREGFRLVPRPARRSTLRFALRFVGSKTRGDRYVPQTVNGKLTPSRSES